MATIFELLRVKGTSWADKLDAFGCCQLYQNQTEDMVLVFGGVFVKSVSGKRLASDEKIDVKYSRCCSTIVFLKIYIALNFLKFFGVKSQPGRMLDTCTIRDVRYDNFGHNNIQRNWA